jgi:hypothetical protein
MKFKLILFGFVAALAMGGLWLFLDPLPQAPSPTPEKTATLTPPLKPSSGFTETAEAPSESDWLSVLTEKWAQGATPDEILTLLQKIAEKNPALALTLAEKTGRTDEEKGKLMAELASAWAARDPSAAWNWTLAQSSRLQSMPGNAPILKRVMEQMAKSDPEGLLAKASLLLEGTGPAGWDNHVMAKVAMDALIKTGHGDLALAAINEWVQGPQKDKVGGEALEAAARYMAEKVSPADAASWLQSLPACEGKDTALFQRATAWAEKDPAAALGWTQNLGEMRPVAMRSAFTQWMSQDINAAIEWLAPQISSQKPDPTTDRLVDLVVNGCAPEDLSVIADWSQTIPSPALRDMAVRQSVRRWGEQDRGAAIAYVQQNAKLTPEQKKDLLQYLHDLNQLASP